MDNGHTDNFYKDKAWELLQNDIKDIKSAQIDQTKDIQEIKSRINYVYGFAAAIGIGVSIIIEYVRNTIFKPK